MLASPFYIGVSKDFPFEAPVLLVSHKRFLGYPHVYWGSYLCLYQAPETEWNSSDGMFGFMERVDLFLRSAAAGKLDPVGAPMHPPTTPASKKTDLPTVIPKVDAPHTGGKRGLASRRSKTFRDVVLISLVGRVF